MGLPSWVFGRRAAAKPKPSPELVDLVSGKTVDGVLTLVKRKKVSAEDALAAEKAGKGRKSLIAALERASR